MIPDFGVGIRKYLFENQADASHQIEKRLHEQVDKYMPYVEIERVAFRTTDEHNVELIDRNMLSVQIIFSVPNMNFESTIVIDSGDMA